jgi:hypothetical protein
MTEDKEQREEIEEPDLTDWDTSNEESEFVKKGLDFRRKEKK